MTNLQNKSNYIIVKGDCGSTGVKSVISHISNMFITVTEQEPYILTLPDTLISKNIGSYHVTSNSSQTLSLERTDKQVIYKARRELPSVFSLLYRFNPKQTMPEAYVNCRFFDSTAATTTEILHMCLDPPLTFQIRLM